MLQKSENIFRSKRCGLNQQIPLKSIENVAVNTKHNHNAQQKQRRKSSKAEFHAIRNELSQLRKSFSV